MPRWSAAPFEEFSTPEARAYFVAKKEAIIGSFADRLAESSRYIDSLNHQLQELDPLIHSADAVNGELSEDDIHLFAALRALSVARGIFYPPKVAAYRLRMAKRTGIELNDQFAS
jgi:glutaredoxin 2